MSTPGFEIKYQDRVLTVGEVLPLLPLRDVVVFPTMIHPLLVGRPASIPVVVLSRSQPSKPGDASR